MRIYYLAEMPEIEQFWALFEMTGWNQQYQISLDELSLALANSWLVISAYEGERLVGVGRVITDGVLHAMIYEMIVHPDFQRRGIGSQILNIILQNCLEANIRDIQLFCARGARSFYERYGFVARPEDAPGMFYVRDK